MDDLIKDKRLERQHSRQQNQGMSFGAWLVSAFYALIVAILIILAITIIVALVAWAAGNRNQTKCCRKSQTCPAYILNPCPDKRNFSLARVDGSPTGSNHCETGSFTIQRTAENELLYTVTTPPDTFITDIYELEVACESDFPLTSDGCAVDLTAFHHQTYSCETTSNVQTGISFINAVQSRRDIFVSVLVIYSDSDTCTPLRMMTISGPCAKPIILTGSCVTPTCPPESCCDPIIPSFIKVKLPRCHPSHIPETTLGSEPIANPSIRHPYTAAATSSFGDLTVPD